MVCDSENYYVYKIDKNVSVNLKMVGVIHDEGDKIITLVTCTDTYYNSTYNCESSLVSSYPIKEAN